MSFQDACQNPFPFRRNLGSAATIIMSIDSYGSALCGLWIQMVERVFVLTLCRAPPSATIFAGHAVRHDGVCLPPNSSSPG